MVLMNCSGSVCCMVLFRQRCLFWPFICVQRGRLDKLHEKVVRIVGKRYARQVAGASDGFE